MAGHMRTELVADALTMAVGARGGATAGIIFHGDRGSQYMSGDYRAQIAELEVVQSVGRTGVCWDNTVAEAFWPSIKREVVHRYRFSTRARPAGRSSPGPTVTTTAGCTRALATFRVTNVTGPRGEPQSAGSNAREVTRPFADERARPNTLTEGQGGPKTAGTGTASRLSHSPLLPPPIVPTTAGPRNRQAAGCTERVNVDGLGASLRRGDTGHVLATATDRGSAAHG
jgi:hypothetical protein